MGLKSCNLYPIATGDSVQDMIRPLILLLFAALLGACAKEPQPRSVNEFIENPMLLEAAIVRCAQDRTESKYDLECLNARQAAASIQAKEEARRAEELEARSEAKRRALRQTQEAAAVAKRRAQEAEERRKNEDYISQFGELPPVDSGEDDSLVEGNVPTVVIPAGDESRDGEAGNDAANDTEGNN